MSSKKLRILQNITLIFVISIGVLNFYTRDFVSTIVRSLPLSFMIGATIIFVLYTLLLSTYCFYWGKSTNNISIFQRSWWVDKQGKTPEAFTVITIEDVTSGKYRPKQKSDLDLAISHLTDIRQKYVFTIYPD